MAAADDDLTALWPGGPPGPPDAAEGHDPAAVMRFVHDFDGYALAANPACSSVLGWSAAELSSVPYWEFLDPEDQHSSVERVQQTLLSGPRCLGSIEVRMLCRDGTYRRTRWSCRSSTRMERVYSVGIDVTDRAVVDVVERVLVGSWDWHIPSDTTTWSDGMFEIYGIRPGSPSRFPDALDLLHVEDRLIVDRLVRWSLRSGEPYSADHRIVRPDGSTRWLHSAGRVFSGPDGTAERLRGITVDITDRPGMRLVG